MPVEAAPGMTDREHCTYLEAFGRMMVGFAPWLGSAGMDREEEKLRLYWGERARQALSKDPPAKPGAFHRPGKALINQRRLKGVSTATTR